VVLVQIALLIDEATPPIRIEPGSQ